MENNKPIRPAPRIIGQFEFAEKDHPRDGDGKWKSGSGSGGGGGGSSSPGKKSTGTELGPKTEHYEKTWQKLPLKERENILKKAGLDWGYGDEYDSLDGFMNEMDDDQVDSLNKQLREKMRDSK